MISLYGDIYQNPPTLGDFVTWLHNDEERQEQEWRKAHKCRNTVNSCHHKIPHYTYTYDIQLEGATMLHLLYFLHEFSHERELFLVRLFDGDTHVATMEGGEEWYDGYWKWEFETTVENVTSKRSSLYWL